VADAKTERGEMLQDIERLFRVGTTAGLSDGQLLERFAGPRDGCAELAFTALVERHGPMVLRVCRRVLRDPHDAADAFQATFLILARRARSIRRHESVGSWLYGVALRVSWEARSTAARRRMHQQKAAALSPRSAVDPEPDDLGRVVHEELGRLPEQFRAAIVLCDLEEHTCEEAARLLGWPVGTVKSRLARGRERLRPGLARRGLDPSLLSFPLAGALSGPAPTVPAALAEATVRATLCESTQRAAAAGIVSAAVAALTEGVIRAMFLARLKLVAAILLAFLTVAAGTGVAARQRPRQAPEKAVAGVPTEPVSPRIVPEAPDEAALLVAQARTTPPPFLLELNDTERRPPSFRELEIRLRYAEKLLKVREANHRTGAVSDQLLWESQAEVETLQARLEQLTSDLEDELERLKARRKVKQAEVNVSMQEVSITGHRDLRQPEASGAAQRAGAESRVKKAELEEIDLRVKQVERRLARRAVSGKPGTPAPAASPKNASVPTVAPLPSERTDIRPAQPK
jgi:RNA polymerase sigma-70 factor (ECF subfamily)